MRILVMLVAMAGLGLAGPALAQKRADAAQALSASEAADKRVWLDELARWNAEHMAAARRLESVVAALKGHETGFDLHEREVRAHGTTQGDKDVTDMHPRIRTAHEQARNVHDDLMDAVQALERVLGKNLGKNQSFPDTR